MAKVLLDTNIVLDYLSCSRPRHLDAVDLLEALFTTPGCMPVVSAGTLKDAYYILCRHYRNEAVVRERLRDFLGVVELEELTRAVIEAAFLSDEPDLEDGIVRATAELAGAEAIITRDEKAFVGSSVPHMDAHAYCWGID